MATRHEKHWSGVGALAAYEQQFDTSQLGEAAAAQRVRARCRMGQGDAAQVYAKAQAACSVLQAIHYCGE